MIITRNKNIKWWLGVASCVMLFVAIGSFAFVKMKFLMKGVQIVAKIENPDTSTLTQIKGNAKNATYLSLNGREIFIDKDGNFSETIALIPGLSVVTLNAEDKFGKYAEKKFEVMYRANAGVVAYNEK